MTMFQYKDRVVELDLTVAELFDYAKENLCNNDYIKWVLAKNVEQHMSARSMVDGLMVVTGTSLGVMVRDHAKVPLLCRDSNRRYLIGSPNKR